MLRFLFFSLFVVQISSMQLYSDIRGNRAFLDKEISLKAMKLTQNFDGEEFELIIGATDSNEVMTITSNMSMSGDLLILNNGALDIEGAEFKIDGDIFLMNNAELNINNSQLIIEQEYMYEHQAILANNSSLKLVNSTFESSNQSWSLGLTNSASLTMDGSEIKKGFITTGLLESASGEINNTKTPGEFLCFGNNDLSFKDSDFLLYWTVLHDSSAIEIAYPSDSVVKGWNLHQSADMIAGVPFNVSVDNCTRVMWGIISKTGSQSLIKDSKLRTIGLMFNGSDSVSVSNITNRSKHVDEVADISDRTLRLQNCEVTTWSFYPSESSRLYVENSIFGELLGQDSSRSTIANSICDGTGGYLGAMNQSQVFVFNSMIGCQLISRIDAVLIAGNCSLSGTEIDADENSIMALINSQTKASPEAHDNAIIFEQYLNYTEGGIDSKIPVSGTSRILKGPANPIEFTGYRLYFQTSTNVGAWTSIGDLKTEEVYNDNLGIWNTTGLNAGNYNVKIELYHSFGDSVDCVSPAYLNPYAGVDEEINSQTLSVYPNPAQESLYIDFYSTEFGECNISIISLSGEILFSKTKYIEAGYNKIMPDIENINSGFYILRVEGNNLQQSKMINILK